MTASQIARFGLLLLAFNGCAASQPPETFGVSDLASQRLSGPESVTMAGASGFGQLSILVKIGVDGQVIDARAVDNYEKLDPGPALAAARQWQFRPQIFEDRPIQAVGILPMGYESPEIPADPKAPFPEVSGQDFEIVLERGACFGTCPDYRVSIDGSGRIVFTSKGSTFPGTAAEVHRMFNGSNVLWPGTHQARVSPQAVAALLARFRAAYFMGLKADYSAGVTDASTQALTLRVGRVTKRVTDYVGRAVGMPASVTALEAEVDRVAGSERWAGGNAETVALLKDEGFDFKSRAAAALIQSAMRLSDETREASTRGLIVAAVAARLDLDAPANGGAEPVGAMIADYAARSGDEALFDAMASRGFVARMGKTRLDDAFGSEMGCSPSIAKALVAAGANPKAPGTNGNALHAIRDGYGTCARAGSERRIAMARVLIALGVPLEARDSLGWTVLMGCDDPELARLLIAAGANVRAREADGTTPLLSIDDDRVAMLLLRAGADPRAKDENGSVREQAVKGHWPATLAWLDAHGIG